MLSSAAQSCPRCRSRITATEFDEVIVCRGCGSKVTVLVKYLNLAGSIVVVASYACSVLLAHWLTHDIRKFLLPVLECAFMLMVLSAHFLFPLLPRDIQLVAPPRQTSDNWHRDVA